MNHMTMHNKTIFIVTAFLVASFIILNIQNQIQTTQQTNPKKLEVWSSQPQKNVFLQHAVKVLSETQNIQGHNPSDNQIYQILVNDKITYQTVMGFGFALTGGSAMLINKMNSQSKNALLNQLFGRGLNQISISCLRLSMGSSDLDEATFSYNDLTGSETDINQTKFSINPDKKNLIPVLKSILAIKPDIPIISTPWSPPAWMKDNNNTKGGSLKPQYYQSYALYFVKYIRAMQSEGIKIWAITPQNQPLHPGNNPSMYFTAEAQRQFIKNNLGPAFAAAKIDTKIIAYDHNLDKPQYPETIYKDKQASKYVDGAAFHMYVGNASVMGDLHQKYPQKKLYFTEQWTSSEGDFNGDMQWHIKNVIIGTMRNWAKMAFEWNLANDPNFNPHTPGGCTQCKGAVTINGSQFQRNVGYYIIAHASKFVPPGSKRVHTDIAGPIINVAFVLPDVLQSHVMIIYNDSDKKQTYNVLIKGSVLQYEIQGREVQTIRF